MIKSLYEIYGTESNYEVDGVWQDLGPCRIKLARAGNKNTLYAKTFKSVLKRWDKKNYEAVTEEESKLIMAEIYSKAVIKAWEIKDDKGKWESGLFLMKDGVEKKVSATPANIAKCLIDLPDLFTQIQRWADDIKTFQKEAEEEQVQD